MRKSDPIDEGFDIALPAAKVIALKKTERTNQRLQFLNLTFDAVRAEEAAHLVMNQASRQAPFVYVATPNVDHRVRLKREPALKSLYDAAWMTLCDSRIIELLAWFDGVPLRAAPGADLVEYLFETKIRCDTPVNVIGSSQAAIELIKTRYQLNNVRWHQAPMNIRNRPDSIAEAAAFVANNPAWITFICVGSPQQEMVAQAIVQRGDAKGVGLCCGASLEFLSGTVARAPRWMR